MTPRRLGVAAWICGAVCALTAQTAPPGTITGSVVAGDATARPLRYAYVVLIGAATGTLRVTSTDADGHFTAAGLPPDRYLVGASKRPYLGAVAGAKRPAHPGAPIVLAAGQTVSGLVISLPPGAVIAGTILDDTGQPAARVPLTLQQWKMRGTERALVPVGDVAVSTDQHGHYRFYGLAPGDYVVEATPLTIAIPGGRTLSDADVDQALRGIDVPPPPRPDVAERLAPVYFPGTTRMADAQSITLAAGDDREGTDFRLQRTRVASIVGVVRTADGRPLTQALVLITDASTGTSTVSMRVGPDGRFAYGNANPGTYTIVASLMNSAADGFASTTVDVAGADVSSVDLVLGPALQISGRVVFAGASPPPSLAGWRVPVTSVTPRAVATAPVVSPTDAAGAFTVARVLPGRYVIGGSMFFGVSADSTTWTLASVVAGGRDITDLPTDITADELRGGVVVTLSDRWQSLGGRLATAPGALPSDYSVVVFPADRSYWMSGSRRIAVVRPASDGRYLIGGPGPISLPAGDYLVAVVTDLDRDEQFDPAFLSSLVPHAVPVTVRAGEAKTQDLAIR